jgi:hypothetical protein
MISDHLDTETLSALIDGQAPPGARAAQEAHLATCAQCSSQKAALESAVRAVSVLPKVTATAAETREIRRAVLDSAGGRATAAVPRTGIARWGAVPWRRLSWRIYAAAGAVAVVIAGFAGYLALNLGASAPSAGVAAGPALKHDADTNPQAAAIPSPSGAPSFTGDAQVRAYVTAQAAVSGRVRGLSSDLAAGATNGFLGSLAAPGATGVPTSTGAAGAPAGTATQPYAVSPPPTATTTPAEPVPAAAGLSTQAPLAACVETIVAAQPTTTVPVEAEAITYQGVPAWLLVLAAPSPGSATLSPAGNIEQIFVESQPSCATLDHATVTP